MPSAVSESPSHVVGGNDIARPRLTKPLTDSGSLEGYDYNDLTPVIGREFLNLQVKDLLKADDRVIQDLALTSEHSPAIPSTLLPLTPIPVSQRGVVFLRDQDVTPVQMKDFMLRLTSQAGSVRPQLPPCLQALE